MALPELLINSPTPGSREALTTLELELSESGTEMTWVANVPVSLQKAGQFRVVIGSEIILCEAKAEATKKVKILERGAEGSTKAIHTIGSKIFAVPTAEALYNLLKEVGEPASLDEPFTENKIASFTAFEGTSTTGLAVEGGVLKTSDANNHSWYNSLVSITDSLQIVKINYSGNEPVFNLGKLIDSSNYLQAQFNSKTLALISTVAGVATAVEGKEISLTTGTYWLVFRQWGNKYALELRNKDPHTRMGGLLTISQPTYGRVQFFEGNLIGVPAEHFGENKTGHPCSRLAGFNGAFTSTTTTLDDWIIVTPSVTQRHEF